MRYKKNSSNNQSQYTTDSVITSRAVLGNVISHHTRVLKLALSLRCCSVPPSPLVPVAFSFSVDPSFPPLSLLLNVFMAKTLVVYVKILQKLTRVTVLPPPPPPLSGKLVCICSDSLECMNDSKAAGGGSVTLVDIFYLRIFCLSICHKVAQVLSLCYC